jgi:hypothetical protein
MTVHVHKLEVYNEPPTIKSRRGGAPSPQAICRPPCEMSDAELLRFGLAAKYRCSQEEGFDNWRRREEFASQLEAARKEWKKRFPKLPLSITLDYT